jgi:hypothetical protein
MNVPFTNLFRNNLLLSSPISCPEEGRRASVHLYEELVHANKRINR